MTIKRLHEFLELTIAEEVKLSGQEYYSGRISAMRLVLSLIEDD